MSGPKTKLAKEMIEENVQKPEPKHIALARLFPVIVTSKVHPLCNCTEHYIEYEGKPLEVNQANAHNCDYVRWRNSLIRTAEGMADHLYARYDQPAQWSIEFHHAMTALAKSEM